jgi:hypothetical protein
MGWDSIGSRMRAVERAVTPDGPCVIYEGPRTTAADRQENAVRLEEARRVGRQIVFITIRARPLADG